MVRKILCRACGVKPHLYAEDVGLGWQQRKKAIELNQSLHCDGCNEPMEENATVVALTIWRGDEQPRDWEQDYANQTL